MTVIVGVEGKDGACIAADSFLGNYAWYTQYESKIFTREAGDSHVIFGITGNPRWGQIIQYELQTPEADFDNLDRFMAVEFTKSLRKTLEDSGFLGKNNNKEYGGTALIGIGGNIYYIQKSFGVTRCKNYSSCGYGSEMAVGALGVLFEENMSKKKTIGVAKRVVESVCNQSPMCARPVNTYWVGKHE